MKFTFYRSQPWDRSWDYNYMDVAPEQPQKQQQNVNGKQAVKESGNKLF